MVISEIVEVSKNWAEKYKGNSRNQTIFLFFRLKILK
jgi:hypothetical protein